MLTIVRSHACLGTPLVTSVPSMHPLSTPWFGKPLLGTSLLLAALNAAAQSDPAMLAPITVFAGGDTTLTTETSIGSNLGLTLMQTPASVDIISREQITSRGESSVTSAIAKAPGFSAVPHPGNGNSALSVRGFTDGASVMQLYDGLRQYGGIGVTFPFDTWSVERIEVLRGPASVIYGDGAIGGVVNVIPKRPTRGPIENEIQTTIGTQDTARLGLGSGGALSDTVSYRLDVSGNTTDCWVDRGQSSDATFSGALSWEATPDLNVTLSYAYGYQRPMRYFGTPLIDGEQDDALRKQNYNVSDSFMRFRDQWTQLDTTWSPNEATTVRTRLYHVQSDRDWRNAERYVYNPATSLIDRSDNTQITHDQTQTGLTTNAAFKGKLGGLDNTVSVGFDVNQASFKHINNTYAGSSGSVDPYDPNHGHYQSDAPFLPRYQNKADQFALFMEDRLALTNKWSVVGGLRYDHARVTRDDLVTNQRAMSQTFSDVGWRIGTVYDITPDVAVYAQYAEAADPVSGLLMISPANAKFDLARGKQIEVGMKQSFMDNRGEWTLAAYHVRKSNLLSRDADDPSLRVQVGEQSSQGVEASLSFAFAPRWKVEANATMLRSKYDDFTESVGGSAVSRAGNVPPNVPERVANLWLNWDFQPNWTAMGGLRYVGKRYADSANTIELPSYTTTDLALRWNVNPDTTITAHGYNVFNRAYFTTAYYTNTQWMYGPSRRFELTLNHRF